MAEKIIYRADVKQSMHRSAIADINFRRFHKSLADINDHGLICYQPLKPGNPSSTHFMFTIYTKNISNLKSI